MLKRKLAGAGALFISFPNAMLAMIFFMIAIGALNFYFPNVGGLLLLGMALMLGIGFVIGEAIANILQVENGGFAGGGIAAVLVIVLCVYVNIGAGNYRARDYEREVADVAKLQAANDPRWTSLQSDRDIQAGILDNGYLPDDYAAKERLREISAEENAIVKEYVQNSHVNKMQTAEVTGIDWVIDTVFANRKVFTFALLAINLIFGLCVQTWYRAYLEEKGTPTKSKKTNAVSTREVKTSKGSPTPAMAEDKEKFYGFHSPPSEPEKKTGGGRDYSAMGAKGNNTIQLNKTKRKQMLKKYLETNPNASLSEMASAIGVSSGQTVRKYLDEIGYAPQYAQQGAKFSAH
jgi:hypothetical protein